MSTAACSLSGGDQPAAPGERVVTLVTHDSWAARPELLEEFRRESGIKVEVRKSGDAGALTNQLVLSKANPIGDLAYGVDSTFASRALAENVFAEYRSPEADKGPQRYAIDSSARLTAIDVGDVCVNTHPETLAQKGIPEPKSFEDLADPRYKDLLAVESPLTSSPGLAFLLGTIAHFGEPGWTDYWRRLKANGVKVVRGWEEAYGQEFSGSSGKGQRPIVVSYASSPAAEVAPDGKPRTKALLDTCFRQVEYAGVLAGAKHADDAKKVLDFLASQRFQAEVADTMYVYPARDGVPLPPSWQTAAPAPVTPLAMPSDRVQANRERWVEQWRALAQG
ncbi:thiamine transport system substrate-binding protein [Herbihabitans rhizosphaerae]|uniref:Thiamine transport system substrate-binding protein n=1 Tax=Herbihabitans rhizosphaerae TaxID=1872711 RepID=A0A4Q7L4Z5_9PSEU|nr:thiamine ABC transporter substrate-binding protein [Herbihabitans rhizosphaerae]RZS44375.1 thiamine transport system substrate-binding protein [Herbihabitans rhizosphaerae]